MAKKRMFSPDIIDTDVFQDMPQSSRLLYYELCIRADDDGFIGNKKKIMKNAGCSEDDEKVLLSKGFIISFLSGVIVITHWRIHNYIRKDRYNKTIYQEEKSQLIIDNNGAYFLKEKVGMTNDIPLVDTEQNRIEQYSKVVGNNNYTIDNIVSGQNSNSDENHGNGERYGNREANLFEYIEKTFGRPLSSSEFEKINTWNNTDLTKYAVDQAKLANALSVKYIESILRSYDANAITTVEQAKERDKKFQERKNKRKSEEESSIPAGYKVNQVYEENGIKFKFTSDGRRIVV